MLNTFSDWLFNVLVWGAVITLAGLTIEVFVSPIINGVTALVALIVVLVAALFWPKY
jgi:hypothetical protein